MGKIYDTQTYLRVKLNYTADVAANISSVKIKYQNPNKLVGEWDATHVPAEKYVYYDIPAGSPLAIKGGWYFWIYAVMDDTRILIGEAVRQTITEEKT